MSFLNWLRNIFRSKYVIYLEAEVTRLRAEVVRLHDALLVKNGMPPLTPREPSNVKTSGRPLPSQFVRRLELASGPKDKPQ